MKINGKNTWIFKIESRESIKTNRINLLHDSKFLTIEPINGSSAKITVKSGFAWDGCTPKWSVLDLVVGTPDGVINPATGRQKTYHASMVHDALYQFAPREFVTRKQADLIMFDEMARNRFFWRHVYYAFIRLFGGYWWKKHARRLKV